MKYDLGTMSENELENYLARLEKEKKLVEKVLEFRKSSIKDLNDIRLSLGRRQSTIDQILEKESHGSLDEKEKRELADEYDEIDKLLEIINKILNPQRK
jgi:hypothetical protein